MRSQQASVLFDLGTGALSNVREAVDYSRLDAVVISHMHADHFLDVIPLRYALKYGPFDRATRLPLYLPEGGQAMLRQMVAAFASEGPNDFLDEVFDVQDFTESSTFEVGDITLAFARTIHYIETYAIRAESNGKSIVYSSDTAPCDRVVDLARVADVFLCECTLGLGVEGGGVRGHSSAAEAGAMAAAAGVGKLLLTHFGYEHSPQLLEATARERFGGPCSIVDDGAEFTA